MIEMEVGPTESETQGERKVCTAFLQQTFASFCFIVAERSNTKATLFGRRQQVLDISFS
jgi:hypothetical protein